MDLFDTTQRALSAAMHATSTRQSVIASNIANVNTPGYQRQDVDFEDALQSAMGSGDPTALDRLDPVASTDATAAPVRQDGNTVDIDRENTTMTANALQHEALVRVARARIDILTTAMGQR